MAEYFSVCKLIHFEYSEHNDTFVSNLNNSSSYITNAFFYLIRFI